jgi:DNA-binding response OmpR family regulator
MSKILIIEPSGDLRNLVALIVTRLGHTALTSNGRDGQSEVEPDAVLVEPFSDSALKMVQGLRATMPLLPIVCVSHHPPGPTTEALEPVAHVLKPFRIAEIEAAVAAAVAASPQG